jgi:hypothetical protein
LEAIVWALEAELDIAKGESELVELTEQELQAWIRVADSDAEAANTRKKAVPRAIPAKN